MNPIALLAAVLLQATPSTAADVHPDFTGTWKLDLAASDSLDEMLKAQDAPWFARKAAGTVVVTQKIKQKAPEALEVCVETPVATNCDVLKIGAGWEEKKSDKGKVRVRTEWSADGQALVTFTETTPAKEQTPIELRLTRTLQDDGKTTVQLLELKGKDGKLFKARRILRKQ